MATQRPLVSRGERGADFVARRGDGQAIRFYGYVGGASAVLVFSGGRDDAAFGLAAAIRQAVGATADVHLVVRAGAGGAADIEDPGAGDVGGAGDAHGGLNALRDPQGAVHGAYGVDPDGPPALVILDPNVRVVAARLVADDDGGTQRALTAVAAAVSKATYTDEGVTVGRYAPVLFVGDALDATLCARLIAVFERSGGVATGVETTAGAGRVEQTDVIRKRRRDHTVTDPDLLRTLSSHIGRRVMPEIDKAFVSKVNRFEGFKIGCYQDTDRGFFTAHRDNLSPTTAHRRFGLTLNLNDDYDGGELRFPEYGPDRYRPAAGEALVFSGSHLHEVLPVTRGRRFVLLSFLFTDTAGA